MAVEFYGGRTLTRLRETKPKLRTEGPKITGSRGPGKQYFCPVFGGGSSTSSNRSGSAPVSLSSLAINHGIFSIGGGDYGQRNQPHNKGKINKMLKSIRKGFHERTKRVNNSSINPRASFFSMRLPEGRDLEQVPVISGPSEAKSSHLGSLAR